MGVARLDLAARRRRARASRLASLLVVVANFIAGSTCFASEYSSVILELRPSPDAPPPESVVHGYGLSAGQPGTVQLSSVPAESAIDVSFYLPRRALGDFGVHLQSPPNSPRARLERSILVRATDANAVAWIASAAATDPYVDKAHSSLPFVFSVASSASSRQLSGDATATAYAAEQLHVDAAWSLAGGNAFVGFVDSGLATGHPQLAAFAAGKFLGGPFLAHASLDLGRWPARVDADVDELEPDVTANSQCDADGDGFDVPERAGHGTHAVGLAAAKRNDVLDISGTCRYCSVGMMKIVRHHCFPQGQFFPIVNTDAVGSSMTVLVDSGAQIINLSLGTQPASLQFCDDNPGDATCLALAYAEERGVLIVAASGNNRDRLQFPARDSRVVAVGGTDASQSLWNEDDDAAPNNLDECPTPGSPAECGSNYTTVIGEPRQQAVAAAHSVRSTIIPGYEWNARCGDALDGISNDGVGLCTGTSMSAPLVSGIAGILRSINPLVGVGNPDSSVTTPGIRNVLAWTSASAQSGASWSAQFGHGLPDAAQAARRMLGKVGGVVARNRATPLFSFHSVAVADNAYATSPQMASALLINQIANYVPTGATVAGYVVFPGATGQPRADAFVLATDKPLTPASAPLRPLYLLDRERRWPVGCTPINPPCNPNNRDFLLGTTAADLEALAASGFRYRGIQGYVHPPCNPEPGCMPPGTQALYRECRAADDDCAVFLQHQRPAFHQLGYTATAYPGAPIVLGYAYPNGDADGDTLPDAVEHVAGTGVTDTDSDDDGSGDAAEYPLAQLPVSDPCTSSSAHSCTVTLLYDDSFE